MLNKVTLIGNIIKDPEIRITNDGREIANMVLATSEKWKDKATGEQKDKSEFHNIVCFSQGLVNVIKSYVKKGSKLYIEGALQTRKWKDKQGQDRYTTEIVMQGYNCNMLMLNNSEKSNSSIDSHNEAKSNGYQPQDDLDDECPF